MNFGCTSNETRREAVVFDYNRGIIHRWDKEALSDEGDCPVPFED